MIKFFPLSRNVTRPLTLLILIAWVAVMVALVNRSYVQATGNLATDLARYGSSAQWRGVYYWKKWDRRVHRTRPTFCTPGPALRT